MFTGVVTHFYDNKKIECMLSYRNGVLHGCCEWFYKSGELFLVSDYKDGTRSGVAKWFYKSGNLKQEIPYPCKFASGVGRSYEDCDDNSVFVEDVWVNGRQLNMYELYK